MRKTKKYYRDRINESYPAACDVIGEVIYKYGEKLARSSYQLRVTTDYTWNHRIENLYWSKKNGVSVGVYWQGDLTDGFDSISLNDVNRGRIIPAVYDFDGVRTRERHGDITVSKQEVYNAMLQAVERYLKKQPNDV